MAYKNHEGYPDPTSGQAMQNMNLLFGLPGKNYSSYVMRNMA